MIWIDGRRLTRATRLHVGDEAEAEKLLEATLAELRAAPPAAALAPARLTPRVRRALAARAVRPGRD